MANALTALTSMGAFTSWRSILAVIAAVVSALYPDIGQQLQDAILAVSALVVSVDRLAVAHEKRSRAGVLSAQLHANAVSGFTPPHAAMGPQQENTTPGKGGYV